MRLPSMEASLTPLSGLYRPSNLRALYYGPHVVQNHLASALPSSTSKAFVVTGNSLATKTPLIKQVEKILGPKHHAGTFSNIKQHAPIAELDQATELVLKSGGEIDTLISVGGGSPMDAAKVISYRVNEKAGGADDDRFLTHITIPTTLSAAECGSSAGFTTEAGVKTSVSHPKLAPSVILYDPEFGTYTPPHLFLGTGIRSLDHAVESQYHKMTTFVPGKVMTLEAIKQLFDNLPKYKQNPQDQDTITRLFLAAYSSLGFMGLNLKGRGLGLSHTLGYALGSPYGIPHGITSCLTLGHVMKLKANASKADAASIAAILPVLGQQRSGDDVKDSETVGNMILDLVSGLGLKTNLTKEGVGKDQVDIICSRATGGLADKKDRTEQEDALIKGVRQLVESLY